MSNSGGEANNEVLRVTSRYQKGVIFEWIPTYVTNSADLLEYHISSEINALDNFWWFYLYPNGSDKYYREWISLRLCIRRSPKRAVRVTIGTKLPGAALKAVINRELFPDKSRCLWVKRLFLRSELLNEQSRIELKGELTIHCELWIDEPSSVEAQPQIQPERMSHAQPAAAPDVNSAGQADSSVAWAAYNYRSLGMFREADSLEERARGGQAPGRQTSNPVDSRKAQIVELAYSRFRELHDGYLDAKAQPQIQPGQMAQAQPATAHDVNSAWAAYYRSMGMFGEADRLEGLARGDQAPGSQTSDPVDSRKAQIVEQSDNPARKGHDGNIDKKVDSTLQSHLRDLLLTGDDHDVVIKVRNQEFKAHKCMLRVRSPIFAAMFRHEMKESTEGCISIDDCDPEAFGEFLIYVYTGRVENMSPRKAVGLYYAGDKYDFSGLKEVCIQFLEASLSTTSICDVIKLATQHDEKGLLEKAIKFFIENAKEILMTVEWQRFAETNFAAANELCIKAFDTLEKKK